MEETKIIEYIKKSFELKKLKRFSDALEFLTKALDLTTKENKKDKVEILCQMGEIYETLKNFEIAKESFKKAQDEEKENPKALLGLYRAYYGLEQYQKALDVAQKLCEINKVSSSYYSYIKVLIKLGKTQDALEIFNSLDESIKLDCDLLYLISTLEEKEKRTLMLERIVSLDEYHREANLDLIKIEYEKGNYSKVLNYCLNLDDEEPLASYYLALVEANRQNFQKALELFLKAIEFDQNKHDFYLDLAKTYIDLGWLEESYSALKRSINYSLINNKKENLDEKYFLCAWILIKQNKNSLALINLDNIKKGDKFYPKAQILAQTIGLENSNLSNSKKVLEEYLAKEKNNPFLLDSLANVYKELKMTKKAIGIYKKAQKLYPSSIFYTLEIIDLLIDEKDYDQALYIIEEFKEKYSNCANIYNSLARIYYRLKKLPEALQNIEKYLELDKNNPESFYFKGLILNDLNEFEKAKNEIYYAIKLNPTVAKYYNQMARSYFELEDYNSALLYSIEAIDIDNNEIAYKKLAYEAALKLGDKKQIELYEKLLKRSEKILKNSR